VPCIFGEFGVKCDAEGVHPIGEQLYHKLKADEPDKITYIDLTTGEELK
jgi:hypothetical protein